MEGCVGIVVVCGECGLCVCCTCVVDSPKGGVWGGSVNKEDSEDYVSREWSRVCDTIFGSQAQS